MAQKVPVFIIFALFAGISLIHHSCQLYLPNAADWQDVFLKFLFVPIILAAFWWGLKGGLTLGALAACVSVVDFFTWCHVSHDLFFSKIAETILFVVVGGILGWLVDEERQTKGELHRSERKATSAFRKSVMDPLTHAFNRRYQDVMLRTFWAAAKKYNEPFTLLMIDLNKFKEINDEHGHQMGDRVLQSTVQTIFNQIRQTDLVCRFGGDEFLIILHRCPKEAALSMAKRLRNEIAKITFSDHARPFKADFSVGIIEYSPEFKNLKEMLTKLDQALYRAKKDQSKVALAG